MTSEQNQQKGTQNSQHQDQHTHSVSSERFPKISSLKARNQQFNRYFIATSYIEYMSILIIHNKLIDNNPPRT